ncbi:hypothetical protein Ciccas_011394 [Cichlidogyrus casuarinus]|uniref:Uncharacterized protein n=1 Tax=Cichlidogyrus casuarinus TaxID=1844966 RepID=A0ABD2PUA3_9PLAT
MAKLNSREDLPVVRRRNSLFNATGEFNRPPYDIPNRSELAYEDVEVDQLPPPPTRPISMVEDEDWTTPVAPGRMLPQPPTPLELEAALSSASSSIHRSNTCSSGTFSGTDSEDGNRTPTDESDNKKNIFSRSDDVQAISEPAKTVLNCPDSMMKNLKQTGLLRPSALPQSRLPAPRAAIKATNVYSRISSDAKVQPTGLRTPQPVRVAETKAVRGGKKQVQSKVSQTIRSKSQPPKEQFPDNAPVVRPKTTSSGIRPPSNLKTPQIQPSRIMSKIPKPRA